MKASSASRSCSSTRMQTPRTSWRRQRLLRDAGFSGPVSLSHLVSGQYREYERTSTTVVDAYVRPAVSGYLERLESGLREEAFAGECLITTSAGGCLAFGEARSRPFETAMSGPVAGAVGASKLCASGSALTSPSPPTSAARALTPACSSTVVLASSTRARSSACRCRRPGSTSGRSGPAAARSPSPSAVC